MTAKAATIHSVSVGQTVGGCRVVRFLSRGGMGEVYLADHLRLQKPVALKILPKGMHHGESIARFLKEARSGSRIEHPNVVSIYDVGQDGDLYYLVMQYVDGRNLSELQDRQGGPFPWRTALQIGRRVAAGLQAVHQRGLIHRDIKPSNIMVTSSDGRVLLMDFGLVRDQNDSQLTQAGQVLGTPLFMSPEQCRGEPLDHRSDMYSLGSTLYYMLAGRGPFGGRRHELLAQIAGGHRPTAICEVNPTVPRDVSDLVNRLLSPEAKDRPSAADVQREMAAVLRQAPQPQSPFGASDTSQFASALGETQKLPELIPIDDEALPLAARLTRRGALLAGGVLSVSLAGGLVAWLARGPNLSGMIYIEGGNTQLGVGDAKKLAAYLASLPELAGNDSFRESALELMTKEPYRRVFVKPFWIDTYEVTNSEYARFVRSTGRAPPIGWNGARPPAGREDHPVTNVSFADAEAYAAWAGKKLPSVEQWTRAFRGDSGRLYPWGDAFDPLRANVFENKSINPASSTPVSATPRDVSTFGVYNLAGNASELLRDRASDAGTAAAISKGGDYLSSGSVYGAASTERLFYLDGKPAPQAGFRCVVE